MDGEDFHKERIFALEFSHDGTKLAVLMHHCNYVHILETESGNILTVIKVCNTDSRDILLFVLIAYQFCNIFKKNPDSIFDYVV